MTSEDVKKELLERDGVSVKEEVDDDFFNDLIGDEEKKEGVDDAFFNGLVGGKEEEKPAEEVDDEFFNDLIGEDKPEEKLVEEKKEEEEKKQKDEKDEKEDEKEEAVFTKHEMTLVAKHRTTPHLLIP